MISVSTPALIFMLILEIPLSSLIKSVIILSLRIPFSMASPVIAGNIPNTMPDDVYERILERIKGKDVRLVLE